MSKCCLGPYQIKAEHLDQSGDFLIDHSRTRRVASLSKPSDDAILLHETRTMKYWDLPSQTGRIYTTIITGCEIIISSYENGLLPGLEYGNETFCFGKIYNGENPPQITDSNDRCQAVFDFDGHSFIVKGNIADNVGLFDCSECDQSSGFTTQSVGYGDPSDPDYQTIPTAPPEPVSIVEENEDSPLSAVLPLPHPRPIDPEDKAEWAVTPDSDEWIAHNAFNPSIARLPNGQTVLVHESRNSDGVSVLEVNLLSTSVGQKITYYRELSFGRLIGGQYPVKFEVFDDIYVESDASGNPTGSPHIGFLSGPLKGNSYQVTNFKRETDTEKDGRPRFKNILTLSGATGVTSTTNNIRWFMSEGSSLSDVTLSLKPHYVNGEQIQIAHPSVAVAPNNQMPDGAMNIFIAYQGFDNDQWNIYVRHIIYTGSTLYEAPTYIAPYVPEEPILTERNISESSYNQVVYKVREVTTGINKIYASFDIVLPDGRPVLNCNGNDGKTTTGPGGLVVPDETAHIFATFYEDQCEGTPSWEKGKEYKGNYPPYATDIGWMGETVSGTDVGFDQFDLGLTLTAIPRQQYAQVNSIVSLSSNTALMVGPFVYDSTETNVVGYNYATSTFFAFETINYNQFFPQKAIVDSSNYLWICGTGYPYAVRMESDSWVHCSGATTFRQIDELSSTVYACGGERLYYWTGTEFSVVTSSPSSCNLLAAGSSKIYTTVDLSIRSYNGSTWKTEGEIPDGSIHAMIWFNNRLIIGGEMNQVQVDGNIESFSVNVAAFSESESEWQYLPGLYNVVVTAFAKKGDEELYAAGLNGTTPEIYAFRNNAWVYITSPADPVRSMQFIDDSLYVSFDENTDTDHEYVLGFERSTQDINLCFDIVSVPSKDAWCFNDAECNQFYVHDDLYCPSPYIAFYYKPEDLYVVDRGDSKVTRVLYHMSAYESELPSPTAPAQPDDPEYSGYDVMFVVDSTTSVLNRFPEWDVHMNKMESLMQDIKSTCSDVRFGAVTFFSTSPPPYVTKYVTYDSNWIVGSLVGGSGFTTDIDIIISRLREKSGNSAEYMWYAMRWSMGDEFEWSPSRKKIIIHVGDHDEIAEGLYPQSADDCIQQVLTENIGVGIVREDERHNGVEYSDLLAVANPNLGTVDLTDYDWEFNICQPVATSSQFTTSDCSEVSASATLECSVSSQSLDFGTLTETGSYAESSFTLYKATTGVVALTIDGPNANEFAFSMGGGVFSDNWSQEVSSSGVTVTIRFTPTIDGDKTAVVASDCLFVDCSSTISLSGEASFVPQCEISPSTLSFGTIIVGSSSTADFAIKNVGGGTLSGTLSFSGSSGPFLMLTDPDYSLKQGESKIITVQFSPSAESSYSSTIDSGSGCTLFLNGTGSENIQCDSTLTYYDFGAIDVGDSSSIEVTIENNSLDLSGAEMISGTIGLEGDGDQFSVTGDGYYQIYIGENHTVDITFAPTQQGEWTRTISTGSTCPGITVHGIGVEPAACSPSVESVNFGDIPIGETTYSIFTIQHISGGSISGDVSLSQSGSEFALVKGSGPFTLSSGQSKTIQVSCTPTQQGKLAATIITNCGNIPVTASPTLLFSVGDIVERDTSGYGKTFMKKASVLVTYAGDLSDLWKHEQKRFNFVDDTPHTDGATKGLGNLPFELEYNPIYGVDPVHIYGDITKWIYFNGHGPLGLEYGKFGISADPSDDPSNPYESEIVLLTENAIRPKIEVNQRNHVMVAYEKYVGGQSQIEIKATGDLAQDSMIGNKTNRLTKTLTLEDFSFSHYITVPGEGINQLCDIAIDRNNVTHATWQSNRDGYWEIYYANGLDLFYPVRVTRVESRSGFPAIGFDEDGHVFIVYHDNRFGPYQIMISEREDSRYLPLFEQDAYLASHRMGYEHYTNEFPIQVTNELQTRYVGSSLWAAKNDYRSGNIENYIFQVNPLTGEISNPNSTIDYEISSISGDNDGILYGITINGEFLRLSEDGSVISTEYIGTVPSIKPGQVDIETSAVTESGISTSETSAITKSDMSTSNTCVIENEYISAQWWPWRPDCTKWWNQGIGSSFSNRISFQCKFLQSIYVRLIVGHKSYVDQQAAWDNFYTSPTVSMTFNTAGVYVTSIWAQKLEFTGVIVVSDYSPSLCFSTNVDDDPVNNLQSNVEMEPGDTYSWRVWLINQDVDNKQIRKAFRVDKKVYTYLNKTPQGYGDKTLSSSIGQWTVSYGGSWYVDSAGISFDKVAAPASPFGYSVRDNYTAYADITFRADKKGTDELSLTYDGHSFVATVNSDDDPILYVHPTRIEIDYLEGYDIDDISITLQNIGGRKITPVISPGTIDFNYTTSWSGGASLAHDQAVYYDIQFVQPWALDPGTYEGTWSVTSSGGNETITVVLKVSAANRSVIDLSTYVVNLESFFSSPPSLSFTVDNSGTNILWYTVTPEAGYMTSDIVSGQVPPHTDIKAWGTAPTGSLANFLSQPFGEDVIDFAIGEDFAVIIKSNGSLAVWGDNSYNQYAVPVGTYTKVVAGRRHAAALKSDGTIECWGDNSDGQCTVPAGTYLDVAANNTATFAVKSDGSLTAWGSDDSLQITNIPAGTNYSKVAAGENFGVYLTNTGSVSTWGTGSPGAAPSSPYVEISARTTHYMARASGGDVDCVGDNTYGQSTTPGSGYTAIAAIDNGSLAVQSDGSIAFWGNTSSDVYTNLPSGNTYSQISGGYNQALAAPFDQGSVKDTVNVSFTKIPPGVYSSSIRVDATPGTSPAPRNAPTTISVNWTVNDDLPSLDVTPDETGDDIVVYHHHFNTNMPADRQFAVRNAGGLSLNYDIEPSSTTYLTLTRPDISSLGRDESQNIIVSFSNLDQLPIGDHRTTINFTNTTVSSNVESRTVLIRVTPDPVPDLRLQPPDPIIIFEGQSVTSATFSAWNGNSDVNLNQYTISYNTDSPAWITAVNPSTGSSSGPDDKNSHYMTLDTSSLTASNDTDLYQKDIFITDDSPGLGGTYKTKAKIYVNPTDSIIVDPVSISAIVPEGASPASMMITINNIANVDIDLEITNTVDWATFDSTSFSVEANSTQTIYLSLSTANLDAGRYPGSFTIRPKGSGTNQWDQSLVDDVIVSIDLRIGGWILPGVSISPLKLYRSINLGDKAQDQEITIRNNGSFDFEFDATGSSDWVSVESSSNIVEIGTSQFLTVKYDVSNLGAGIYTSSVSVVVSGQNELGASGLVHKSNSSQTSLSVPITLKIIDDDLQVTDMAVDETSRVWLCLIGKPYGSLSTSLVLRQINPSTAAVIRDATIFTTGLTSSQGGLAITSDNRFYVTVYRYGYCALYVSDSPAIVPDPGGEITLFNFTQIAADLGINAVSLSVDDQDNLFAIDKDNAIYLIDREDGSSTLLSYVDNPDPYIPPYATSQIEGIGHLFQGEIENYGESGTYHVYLEFYDNPDFNGDPKVVADSRIDTKAFLTASIEDPYEQEFQIDPATGIYLLAGESGHITFNAQHFRPGMSNKSYPFGFSPRQTYFAKTFLVLPDGSIEETTSTSETSFSCPNCQRSSRNSVNIYGCSYSFIYENTTSSLKNLNFRVIIYSDKEKQDVVKLFNLTYGDDDLQYVMTDDDIYAESVWRENGLKVSAADSVFVHIYPDVDSIDGLTCGITYFVDVLKSENGNEWESISFDTWSFTSIYGEKTDFDNIALGYVGDTLTTVFAADTTIRYATYNTSTQLWSVQNLGEDLRFDNTIKSSVSLSSLNENTVIAYVDHLLDELHVLRIATYLGQSWLDQPVDDADVLDNVTAVNAGGNLYLNYRSVSSAGHVSVRFAFISQDDEGNNIWQTSDIALGSSQGQCSMAYSNGELVVVYSLDGSIYLTRRVGTSWTAGTKIDSGEIIGRPVVREYNSQTGIAYMVKGDIVKFATYDGSVTITDVYSTPAGKSLESKLDWRLVRNNPNILFGETGALKLSAYYYGHWVTSIFKIGSFYSAEIEHYAGHPVATMLEDITPSGIIPSQPTVAAIAGFYNSQEIRSPGLSTEFFCDCSSSVFEEPSQHINEIPRWKSDIRLTDTFDDCLRPTISVRHSDAAVIAYESGMDNPIIKAGIYREANQDRLYGTGSMAWYDYDFNIAGKNTVIINDLYENLCLAYDIYEVGTIIPSSSVGYAKKQITNDQLPPAYADELPSFDNQYVQFEVNEEDELIGKDPFLSGHIVNKIRIVNIDRLTYNASGQVVPVVSSCNITMQMYGTPEVFAYRLRNENQDEYFGWQPWQPELGRYYIEIDHILSNNSGIKEICVQLMTYGGATKEFCIPVIADFEEPPVIIRLAYDEEFTTPVPTSNTLPIVAVNDTTTVFFNTAESPTVVEFDNRRKIFLEIVTKDVSDGEDIYFTVLQQGTADNLYNKTVGGYTQLSDGRYGYKGQFYIYVEDKLQHVDGLARVVVDLPHKCADPIEGPSIPSSTPASDAPVEINQFNFLGQPGKEEIIADAVDDGNPADEIVTDVLSQYRQAQSGKVGIDLTIRPTDDDPYFIFGDPDYYFTQKDPTKHEGLTPDEE